MRSFELSSFLALAVTKKQKNVCNCAGCEGIVYQLISKDGYWSDLLMLEHSFS